MTTRKQLRELRKRYGISQARAAELVHVQRRAWERWESGSRSVPEMAVHLFCLLVGETYPTVGRK